MNPRPVVVLERLIDSWFGRWFSEDLVVRRSNLGQKGTRDLSGFGANMFHMISLQFQMNQCDLINLTSSRFEVEHQFWEAIYFSNSFCSPIRASTTKLKQGLQSCQSHCLCYRLLCLFAIRTMILELSKFKLSGSNTHAARISISKIAQSPWMSPPPSAWFMEAFSFLPGLEASKFKCP